LNVAVNVTVCPARRVVPTPGVIDTSSTMSPLLDCVLNGGVNTYGAGDISTDGAVGDSPPHPIFEIRARLAAATTLTRLAITI
jgi:hypothetical protein